MILILTIVWIFNLSGPETCFACTGTTTKQAATLTKKQYAALSGSAPLVLIIIQPGPKMAVAKIAGLISESEVAWMLFEIEGLLNHIF
ncbi:hypothetical protein [Mucilaginibacter sp. UR6-11]|uniref:hypothetical protein n=1 Tax=Mucilaginibacter sp. UR6-11 TaxID=1435644 RepID=UPI001E6391BB|nr:hypothetical protein [Mucilaginibacter sp. UR6-11]MCC8423486.1 hypothetical protein [Mucilaginibacter sp. UR6-11]